MRSTRKSTLGVLVAVLAFAGAAPAVAAGTAPTAVGALVNPGFEAGLTGWTVTSATGHDGAAKVESVGHGSSSGRLTHWAGDAYDVTTSQTVEGLATGWWTASAWVRSGGALDATRLALTGCGVDDATTTPVTEQDDQWVRLSVSAHVTGGDCTVAVVTGGAGGAWASVDDVTLERGRVVRDVRGGDLSGVAKNEDFGATYASTDGTPGDPVEILADAGMNLGRLKVWVDPADGYNEITHVVESARRIEAAGMDVMIDFHYSDRWTDPGAQGTPAAWVGGTTQELAQDVYDHTHDVLVALREAGVTTDYVQVGNEINPGMMWPYGQTWDVVPGDGYDTAQWDSLAAFLSAGSRAVRDATPEAQVILHLTNINDGIGGLTWWFDEVTSRGVDFDVIGLSYYGYWHGSLGDLQDAVGTLSERYDRDVMVVETAYPFTLEDGSPAWENVVDTEAKLVPGYPATPAGQAAALRAVQDVVASAPGGRGLGVVYWEPAWTSVEGNGWDPADPSSGNAWENQAMFDLDGRLLAPVAAELAPDGATSAWSASAVYTAGDVVLHDGGAYVASWWTSGQEPGASADGPWQEAAAADETGTSPWAATRVYVAGERVTFDGSTFAARWWTRNQQPDGSAWGPWERVG
ncbi:glycosyl hydrolase 53 family protein [Oerskovia sp. NPDC057915]|uniref:glycosyl hydrolase 53 family protein n=1 Tax=Oerskovia sp. NPDC057915 TaxID=3346280 RepID=UPI0036DA5310